MSIKQLFLCSILISLVSCKPQSANNTVVIGTEGIYDGVLVEVIGGSNRGEVLVESDPVYIDIRIENLSKYNITDISLDFKNVINSAEMEWAYVDSGDPHYPGDNGRGCIQDNTDKDDLCPCSENRTLVSSSESSEYKCYLSILYNPEKVGYYIQPIVVNYKNLVENIEEKRILTFSTGHAASLVAVGEESFFDFGVVEQTSIDTKTKTIFVQNRGDLTAKNIYFEVGSEITPPPVVVEEHDCPYDLGYLESCNVTVSYTALNNRVIDDEGRFNSVFSMKYIDDAKERLANLNLFYEFFSTKIKAIFLSQNKKIDFPSIVAGNISEKEIRINNVGLREGTINKIIFYNENDDPVMYCKSSDGSNKLFCYSENDMMARLIEVPFEVYDLNQCLGRVIRGVSADMSGGDCFLKIVFHPSLNIESEVNIKNWSLGLSYLSNWHNDPTIEESEKILKINANATRRAKLSVSIKKNDSILKLIDDDLNMYNFGGVNLIQPDVNLEQNKITITLANSGQGEITILGTEDGQSDPFSLTEETKTITSVLYPDEISYYKNISNVCKVGRILEAGDTCDLSFDIVPVFFNDMFKEENMLFDHGTENIGFNINKYKEFIFYFKDNSTYNDDYTLTEDLQSSVKLTGALKFRGVLEFDTGSINHNLGSLKMGEGLTHTLKIKNVGTGPVQYIKFKEKHNPFIYSNLINNPFFIIPIGNLAEGDKDCYYIIDFNEKVNLSESYEPKGILNPGESCHLMIYVKVRDDAIKSREEYEDRISDSLREYSQSLNNTQEIWEYRTDIKTSLSLSLSYRDGDQFLLNQENDDYNFYWGNEKDVTFDNESEVYTVNFTPKYAGKWLLSSPLPSTSALIYRPSITYPFVSFPSSLSFDSYIADELWILLTEDEVSTINNQKESKKYVKEMINEYAGDYLFHAGTFPVGQSYDFSFVLFETGQGAEIIDFEFNNLSAGNEIILNTSIDNIKGKTSGNIKLDFVFTPGSNIRYESEVIITYYNGLKDKNGDAIEVQKEIKVIAEGITHFPELKISYQLYDVKYNNDLQEIEETLLPEVFNIPTVYNGAYLDEITLSEIKNSKSYSKVTVKIENISNLPLEGLEVIPNSVFNIPDPIFIESDYSVVYFNTCLFLGPGDECEFDIEYNPIERSIASSFFITLNYNITNNQSISSGFNINLTPLSTAFLTSLDLQTFYVTDSDSGISLPSFEHNFGSINNPDHIILTGDYPQIKSSSDIVVTNTTNMNASFLKSMEEILLSIDGASSQFKVTDSLGTERIITIPVNNEGTLNEFKKYTYQELAKVIEGLLNENQNSNDFSVIFSHMEGKYIISSNLDFKIEWVNISGEQSRLWELMGFNDASILSESNLYGSDLNLLECNYEGKDYKIHEKDINDTKLIVCATRSCIIGDDQENLEFYKKGFNSESLDLCEIEIFIELNENYISKTIDPGSHLVNLNYYNNNRETTGFITFNLNGYVEANKSIAETNNGIYDVQSKSDGSVIFSWDHAVPESYSWGRALGYRIFYGTSRSQLESKITNNSDLVYFDVDISSNNVRIEGLIASRYYYFKVDVLRKKNNIIYSSEIKDSEILDLVVPPRGSIYIHDYKVLVEKRKPDEIGIKESGVYYCNRKSWNIVNDGVSNLYSGRLINQNIWNYLKLDPDTNNYSNYSDYNIIVISHWLGDDPVDISTYFEDYGFNSFNMGQYVPEEQLIYQKNCTTAACDELSMVVGGDGVDLPLDALFFVDAEKIFAAFRCYSQL